MIAPKDLTKIVHILHDEIKERAFINMLPGVPFAEGPKVMDSLGETSATE
jgi:hypothetical protein